MSVFISEVDCKDQFNNIQPDDIKQHFTTASKWLTKRKQLNEILVPYAQRSQGHCGVGDAQ